MHLFFEKMPLSYSITKQEYFNISDQFHMKRNLLHLNPGRKEKST